MSVFSGAALFIMFREALEAAVIIAIMLQLLQRLNMPHLRKHVWIGAAIGVGISIILGVVFCIVFYVANQKIFDGRGKLIFSAVIKYIAALLITYVAFHMLKFYNLERKWRRKLQDGAKAAAEGRGNHKWSVLLLAGSATLREGIESVLFLTGVSAGQSVKSVIIPAIVGLILGVIAGVVIYYSGRTIRSLKWFFVVSCGVLFFIAAGMVCTGTGDFQAALLWGVMFPYEWRPWTNKVLWDMSGCCSTSNEFWKLLSALFGYVDQPTSIQLMFYILYWAVAVTILIYKWRAGNLTDRKAAEMQDAISFANHNLEGAKSTKSLGLTDSDVEKGVSESDEQSDDSGSPTAAATAAAVISTQQSAPTAPPAPPAPLV